MSVWQMVTLGIALYTGIVTAGRIRYRQDASFAALCFSVSTVAFIALTT